MALVFTAFGEADGLPSSSIDALVETPDGVLWVATSHGLARRREARFESVDLGTRVVGSGRFGLASDSAGRLYLSTIDGLLVSNPPPRRRQRRFEPVHGQPAGPAYGVHVDRSGALWFGCGAEVCRLSGETITVFGLRQGVPSDRWDAITTDHEGAVWIRSSTHLLRKAGSGNQFERIPESIPHMGDFATLSLGRDGSLFVPTDDGVWELSNGRWRGIGRGAGSGRRCGQRGTTGSRRLDLDGPLGRRAGPLGGTKSVGGLDTRGGTQRRARLEDDARPAGPSVGSHRQRCKPDAHRPTNGTTGVESLDRTRRLGRQQNQSHRAGSGRLRVDREFAGRHLENRSDFRKGAQVFVTRWSRQRPDLASPLSITQALSGCARAEACSSLIPEAARRRSQRQILPMGDPAETVSSTLEDRQGRLWVAGTQGLARRENGIWKRFTKQDGLPSNAAGFLAEGPGRQYLAGVP